MGRSRGRSALLPRLPRDAWVVLAGDTLSAVGTGLTLPFLFVYLSRVRGIDVAVAGAVVGTVALAGFVGNPLGGWLGDRIGHRRALVVGLVVAAAGAFLVTGVRTAGQAFAAAAVIGLGTAVVWPTQDALLASVVHPDQRPSVFAVRHATLNAGYAVGGVASALIADLDEPGSFVTLYVVDGLSFLAFVPILLFLLPHAGNRPLAAQESDGAPPGGYRAVLADRMFVRVWLLVALLVTVGYAQMESGFTAFATGDGGIEASGLSIAFATNMLVVVLLQLPVLRALEGTRRTTGIALAASCWGLAWTVTIAAATVGGGLRGVVAFSLALGLFGAGETLLAPSHASLVNDLAPDELRGRYNGIYAMAWTTGYMVGPAIAGVALDAGQGGALFAGLALTCAGCAVLAIRLGARLPAGINIVTAARPAPSEQHVPA